MGSNSFWIKAKVPEDNLIVGNFLVRFSIVLLNPIPTVIGRNQPIYEYHVTTVGRHRVKNTVRLKHNNQEVYWKNFLKPNRLQILFEFQEPFLYEIQILRLFTQNKYRISFFESKLMYCDLLSQCIQVRKLFKRGNYSRA